MEEQVYNPLDDIRDQLKTTRRELLPLWIKIFLWIFLVVGGGIVLGLIAALFGLSYSIEIYGLSSNGPLNAVSLVIVGLYFIKVITAFGLWTEKDWAVDIAFYDAIVGIGICTFMMFGYPFFNLDSGFHFTVRLELLVLVPYLMKMNTIKDEWKVARITA